MDESAATPPKIVLTQDDYRSIMEMIDLAVKGHGLALSLSACEALAQKVQAVATQEAEA